MTDIDNTAGNSVAGTADDMTVSAPLMQRAVDLTAKDAERMTVLAKMLTSKPDAQPPISVCDLRGMTSEGNYLCCIRAADGAIVAAGKLVVYRLNKGPVARVEDMITDPKYRNRGLGDLILVALEAKAAERGCVQIDLTTTDERGQVAWYGKRGYVRRETNTMRKNLTN